MNAGCPKRGMISQACVARLTFSHVVDAGQGLIFFFRNQYFSDYFCSLRKSDTLSLSAR
jgi:hypothetical protein